MRSIYTNAAYKKLVFERFRSPVDQDILTYRGIVLFIILILIQREGKFQKKNKI